MFVSFFTFGCKVNQYETELMRQNFEKCGHITVRGISDADICVINSCTVTAQSDLKLRQLVNRIRRENPSAVLALCGCYPQAFGDTIDADIVVGSENKQRLAELVEKYVETRLRIVEIDGGSTEYPTIEQLTEASQKTRGVIKIQDGCDRFCSYCIIPYARGRSRSKPLSEIETEAKTLANAGHKELVIVGINLSDYGKGTKYNLADAVEAVAKSGAARIRLGSLEPEELSTDIIDRLANINNLCPQFHIALQSGCDKTLREMRRKYDKSKYFTLIEHIRKCFPKCAITTDIMVGFPGETEEDFTESLETVKLIGFADAHVFPYSPREGTPAAKRTDQVTGKEHRAKLMSEAVKESADAYRHSLIGTVQQVLFEREKSPDFHQGHAANYQLVKVNRFTETLFRKLRDVLITGVDGDSLIGEIVQR